MVSGSNKPLSNLTSHNKIKDNIMSIIDKHQDSALPQISVGREKSKSKQTILNLDDI